MVEEKVKTDLKAAQKKKDELKVSVLRLLLSAFHNRQIEKQRKLAEEDFLEVINSQIKQRKQSIEAFKKGGREELVEKEKKELEILKTYLPARISEGELEEIVSQVISSTGVKDASSFGKVMGKVMAKVKGRAQGQTVAKIVKRKLSS